jgi:hypothetical protein
VLVEHRGKHVDREAAAMNESVSYRTVVESTWQTLQPSLAEAKCAGCECLQTTMVELRLALDDLPADARTEALRQAIEKAESSADRHPCLGCEPCLPSNVLADFYREQARRAATQAACDT